MIKQVVCFSAELEFLAFRDREALVQTEIDVRVSGPADVTLTASAKGNLPAGRCCRRRKSGWIEPLQVRGCASIRRDILLQVIDGTVAIASIATEFCGG